MCVTGVDNELSFYAHPACVNWTWNHLAHPPSPRSSSFAPMTELNALYIDKDRDTERVNTIFLHSIHN